ncbi:hypothetical protein HDU97_005838 [Phlyctochytrium planicorne]|nr:hypothetical protein HDU97_005838 [Phlyctochytrium planicorne]
MPSPESSRTSKPRIEWFNDPYLLADRVTTLLQSSENEEYALELVERHTGSSNEYVYGALIAGLVRNKRYNMALDIFKELRKKKVKPSPHTYTMLFRALGMLAAANPTDLDQVRSRYVDLVTLWSKTDPASRNIRHVNAVLSSCKSMTKVGGLESGLGLFASVSNLCKKRRDTKENLPQLLSTEDAFSETFELPLGLSGLAPDASTYTSAMLLFARAGGEAGFEAAKLIWEEEIPKSKVELDSQLVTSMILACEKGDTEEAFDYGRALATQYFLNPPPKQIQGKGKSKSKKSPEIFLTEPSFDIILRLASKSKDANFGEQVLKIGERKQMRYDFLSLSNAITILRDQGNLSKAWSFARRRISRRKMESPVPLADLKLRICMEALNEEVVPELKPADMDAKSFAAASSSNSDEPSEWVRRSLSIIDDEILNHIREAKLESGKASDTIGFLIRFFGVLNRPLWKESAGKESVLRVVDILKETGDSVAMGIERYFSFHAPEGKRTLDTAEAVEGSKKRLMLLNAMRNCEEVLLGFGSDLSLRDLFAKLDTLEKQWSHLRKAKVSKTEVIPRDEEGEDFEDRTTSGAWTGEDTFESGAPRPFVLSEEGFRIVRTEPIFSRRNERR